MRATVLVTGATGNIGSALVPVLISKGVPVRALVRTEAAAPALRAQGAEVVLGDLDDAASLSAAVSGIDQIFLLTWNGPTAVDHARNLVRAALAAGRPHIVRLSAHGSEKSRIIRDHRKVEDLVKASGLPYTILRPTYFMQNVMMAAPSVNSQGVVYMPFGNGKVVTIDVRDVVEAALAVLTSPGHEGRTFVLTGPRAVSYDEIASALSSALNKEVRYVDVPSEAGKKAMLDMGMPEWIADGYIELIEEFANDWGTKVYPDVATLTGHPPRSIEQFAVDFSTVFGAVTAQTAR